ncbi:MAG: type II secretion system protein, partial [Clostridia bacterium]|nr:type II secretion system protein [Clostridia bacterium]
MRSTKKGFTLVELLVVIAILAILATVSVVGYTAFIEKAHQSVAMQEMTQIRNALVAEDITNKNFNLEDGISGEGLETVYAAEGDPVGGQSEAFYVLEFVKELGIAGTFQVSEGKLLFSPAGKDATATCDFVTGEISTAKGALEDDDQSTEPVDPQPHECESVCPDCGKCTNVECNETVCAEKCEGHACEHEGGTATCTQQATCTKCGQAYGDLADHVAEDTGNPDCTVPTVCSICGTVITPAAQSHTGGTATCTQQANCEVCGKAYGELAQHIASADDNNCTTAVTCQNCEHVFVEAKANHTLGENGKCAVAGCEVDCKATITFDDISKRTTLTTEKQVWAENGITVTNNKTNDSSAIVDYSAPVRFYKNSKLIVTFEGMVRIEFHCNTAGYASALAVSNIENATVVQNGKTVTVTFAKATESFTIEKLSDQVRVDSITVHINYTCEHQNTTETE